MQRDKHVEIAAVTLWTGSVLFMSSPLVADCWLLIQAYEDTGGAQGYHNGDEVSRPHHTSAADNGVAGHMSRKLRDGRLHTNPSGRSHRYSLASGYR